MEAKRGSDSIILAQQSSGRVWVGESRDGKKQADSGCIFILLGI